MAYEGGYTSAVNSAAQRDQMAAYVQALQQRKQQEALAFQQAQQQRERQQEAQRWVGSNINQFLQPPPGQGPQSPPPGAPSQPMQQPPQAQMQPPQMQTPMQPPMGMPPPQPAAAAFGPQGPPQGPAPGAPAQQAMPPQPWKPMPQPGPQGGSSALQPPLGQAQGQGQDVMPAQPVTVSVMSEVAKTLKQQGIQGQAAFDILQEMEPFADQQAKSMLAQTGMQIKLQHEVNDFLTKRIKEMETERSHRENEDLKQQMVDVARDRLAARTAGGGVEKAKEIQPIYPRGQDGRPDESQRPIGTMTITKSGKIIYRDPTGQEVPTLEGGTAKEGKDTKGAAGQAVRQSLVKAGATNAMARLGEIEKTYPNLNTSSFFGQHGDSPVTRGIYGAGRGMMSGDQKSADAMWSSFIDEAIPVFTGGLRGSDAFRRFLIEQAPGPGDDAKSRAEKIRLLKANINGTSKAFFNKFASDPSMQAPGTKPEEVEAAKGGGSGGGDTGGWKVEKVGG